MNIQDEMQKIHHKFGVSEMANYKIEQFVEDLIKKDRAEQLILHGVGKKSELLIAFFDYLDELPMGLQTYDREKIVEGFESNL